jgi:tetratricopeptide (TPR) repeat protein
MVSAELQFRAQAEFENNMLPEASATLEQAKSVLPVNSSVYHDSGEVNLNIFQQQHDVRYLEEATASFRKAIALSPEKAGPHIGLSLCLSSANLVDQALEEIRVAERLHPSSTRVQAIARLLEKRKI